MPVDIDTVRGTTPFVFGFATADAPSSVTIAGFTCRRVAMDIEPEVFATATNGEGFAEAVAIALATRRMLNISMTGYIISTFDKLGVGNTFSFSVPPSNTSRFFFIKKISEPRQKGEFCEITIEASSFPLVTS